MPSLVPSRPFTFLSALICQQTSELDLDVDAGGQIQPHQRVDGLRGGVDDVDQTLVRPHLEVLPAVLVLVRRTDHAVHVLLRRQRHRTGNASTRAGHRVDDLARRRVDALMVIGFEPDADLLSRHSSSFSRNYRYVRPPRSGVSHRPDAVRSESCLLGAVAWRPPTGWSMARR